MDYTLSAGNYQAPLFFTFARRQSIG